MTRTVGATTGCRNRLSALCCGSLVQNGQGYWYYSELTCKPAGSCAGKTSRLVCGNTPGACPSGTSCKGSTILLGYKLCG